MAVVLGSPCLPYTTTTSSSTMFFSQSTPHYSPKRVRVFYIHSLHLSLSHLVRAVVVLMCHRYLRTDGKRLDSLIRISLKRSTFSNPVLDHVSSILVHFVLPLIDGSAGFVDMCTYLWYCFSAFEHMCERFGNSTKLD